MMNQPRDIPIGLDTASGPPAVDDAADGRRRLLIVGAVVAVVALVVGVVVLRDDGSQSEQSELFRDAPTAKELGITGVEGNVGPIFDDPLVPGPIRDAFDGMPFGTDHTTARAAQCPTGFARDLSGQDLSGVRWMNRDLRCTDFRGANLAGADLSGSITWGSDFTLVDLTDVTFGNFAQFQATVLAGADLSGQSFPDGVDWGYADLTETNLAGSDAYLDDHNSPHSGEWIVLDNTICPDGSNSDITSCESGLAGAGGVAPGYNPPVAVNPLDPPTIGDIGHPNSLIVAFDHESARLSQCPEGLVRDLRDQDLSGVNWTERDLRCTDFRGTELAGADLSGSLMWGSDFTGVDLTEVRFGSDLVQFQATLLVEANLSGQQFVSVDWGWADLTRTDLSGSTADLSGRGPGHGEPVVFDDTICPDGSNSDDNGGQCQG